MAYGGPMWRLLERQLKILFRKPSWRTHGLLGARAETLLSPRCRANLRRVWIRMGLSAVYPRIIKGSFDSAVESVAVTDRDDRAKRQAEETAARAAKTSMLSTQPNANRHACPPRPAGSGADDGRRALVMRVESLREGNTSGRENSQQLQST